MLVVGYWGKGRSVSKSVPKQREEIARGDTETRSKESNEIRRLTQIFADDVDARRLLSSA